MQTIPEPGCRAEHVREGKDIVPIGRIFVGRGFKDVSVSELAKLTEAAEDTLLIHLKSRKSA